MMICGANKVTRYSKELDALNVFPVPDGDTGINMSATVQAAAREAEKLNTPNIYDVAKAASNGALRGARGNSGVILSQLFRGFAKGLEQKTTADAADLAVALEESAKMAYRAVMKPKEGTILTVARALGEYAQAGSDEDIESALKAVIDGGNYVLSQTPDMLAELKQAGVVDSGGKGLIYFMEGALEGLLSDTNPVVETANDQAGDAGGVAAAAFNTDDIKFAYCTEFLIEAEIEFGEAEEKALTKYLMSQGDSVVVVSDDGIVKVHVHTNHPGRALERGLTIGSLINIKIDNMKEQHTTVLEFSQTAAPVVPAGPEKDLGFVTVVAGKGFEGLFTDLGVDVVIEGGQTMNPSADDIAKAVARVNAKRVVVLPNNKNIVLAAEQAMELVEGKQLHVIPTKSIPQGIACMMDYIEGSDIDSYLADMSERIQDVHCGQVTYAVRSTVASGKEINEGDILCLYDGDIVSTGTDVQESAKEFLKQHMMADGGEFVSIYYGEGVTEDMANELADFVIAENPHMEADIVNGGQPLYYYIFSVE